MATTITSTTLAGATTVSGNVLNVVSATNFSAPTNGFVQQIYVINPDWIRGELMTVISVSGTYITVSRLDKLRQNFVGPLTGGGQGATVLIAPPVAQGALFTGNINSGFQEFDPVGGSFSPQLSAYANPLWVNITTGDQWLFSTLTNLWVPGFNNTANLQGVTAAVASAAGLVTPSGRIFHITGTAAISGFNIPVGFTGGTFDIIPDGAFTTTNANNIAIASTGVVSKVLTYNFDSNLGKFFPSY